MDFPYSAIADNALAVLEQRYFLKDASGNPTETTDEFFARVVNGVVDIEIARGWTARSQQSALRQTYFDFLRQLRFLPNSPCLMNSGKT